jgi:hypothetical protein
VARPTLSQPFPFSAAHRMERDHPPEPQSATQTVRFTDRRAPQEIQWRLERDLMELFAPLADAPKFTLQATIRRGSQRFGLLLTLDSASEATNRYSFTAELSDHGPQPDTAEQLARTLTSWMGFWTRGLTPDGSAEVSTGSSARYARVVEEALGAEAHLTDVPSLQQEVVRRMREGAIFRTAHKEGGTTISHRDGRWSRVDYGESTTSEHFHDEATFLVFLRRFFSAEVSRNAAPDEVPEEKAWRLILRLLQRGDTHGVDLPPRKASTGVLVWGLLTATSIILPMAKVRIAVRGRDPLPGLDALFYPSLGVFAACVLVGGIWLRRHWTEAPPPDGHRPLRAS